MTKHAYELLYKYFIEKQLMGFDMLNNHRVRGLGGFEPEFILYHHNLDIEITEKISNILTEFWFDQEFPATIFGNYKFDVDQDNQLIFNISINHQCYGDEEMEEFQQIYDGLKKILRDLLFLREVESEFMDNNIELSLNISGDLKSYTVKEYSLSIDRCGVKNNLSNNIELKKQICELYHFGFLNETRWWRESNPGIANYHYKINYDNCFESWGHYGNMIRSITHK